MDNTAGNSQTIVTNLPTGQNPHTGCYDYQFYVHPTPNGVCPNCGYCPHCGRRYGAVPYQPQPYWHVGDMYLNPYTITCGTASVGVQS